jgi:hypothetical protein
MYKSVPIVLPSFPPIVRQSPFPVKTPRRNKKGHTFRRAPGLLLLCRAVALFAAAAIKCRFPIGVAVAVVVVPEV